MCVTVLTHSHRRSPPPGFGDRLLNEVRKLAPRDVKIRISAPPERKYSTWIGGCVAKPPLAVDGSYHVHHERPPPSTPKHHTWQVDSRFAGDIQVTVGHAAGVPGARRAHCLEAHAVIMKRGLTDRAYATDRFDVVHVQKYLWGI